jgi:predicted nucleic acid-binding protein
MMTFVDTSAFVALLDRADQQHVSAERTWQKLLKNGNELVSNNYVLVEAYALIQHRYGMQVLRAFHEDAVPLLSIYWLTPEDHAAAVSVVLTANRRGLSLVDCASMETMRRLGIRQIFAFDPHFTELGFESPNVKG